MTIGCKICCSETEEFHHERFEMIFHQWRCHSFIWKDYSIPWKYKDAALDYSYKWLNGGIIMGNMF